MKVVTVTTVRIELVTVTVMTVLIKTVMVTTGYVGNKVMYNFFQIACSMLVKVFHHPYTHFLVKVGPVWSINCTNGDTFR